MRKKVTSYCPNCKTKITVAFKEEPLWRRNTNMGVRKYLPQKAVLYNRSECFLISIKPRRLSSKKG